MKYTEQSFENRTVDIDGNTYKECKFNKCVLEYAGGAVPSFLGCELNDTQFSFTDSAQRTLGFLHAMYHGGFRPVVEDTFREIRETPTRGHEVPE